MSFSLGSHLLNSIGAFSFLINKIVEATMIQLYRYATVLSIVLAILSETYAIVDTRRIRLRGSEQFDFSHEHEALTASRGLRSINFLFTRRRGRKRIKRLKRKEKKRRYVGMPCGVKGLTCPEGMYCRLEGEDCTNSATGVCALNDTSVRQPEGSSLACPRIYRLVCGCDNMEYSNSCIAYHYQAENGIAGYTMGGCEMV